MQAPKTKIASVVAYVGPALCGKADAINHIYNSVPVESRHAPPVPHQPAGGGQGHILSVDITPPWLPELDGAPLTFRLGTVPGRVFEDTARKELIAAADAFVIVIDPRAERIDASIESADNLIFGLKDLGRSIEDHLLAFQLHVQGSALESRHQDTAATIIGQLSLPRDDARIYPADPRTGDGCDLAFKDIALRKYGSLKALTERGILQRT